MEKATQSAAELVERYKNDPKVAVILSATFVHARIKTVVKQWLKQQGRNNVSVLHEGIDLRPALKIAYALGAISNPEFTNLTDLASRRNDIAHHSKFWRKPKTKADQTYLKLANYAITFLNSTGSLDLIRKRWELVTKPDTPKNQAKETGS